MKIKKKNTKKARAKKLLKMLILGMAFSFFLVLCINFMVSISNSDYIYTDIKKVPKTKVGLILGTSRYTIDNKPNQFFYNRIDAAVELYKKKKIKYILVSGDNSESSYNEPREMYKVLVKKGIPKSKIFLDFAGFRTLDSIIRTNKIFGQDSFIIISQEFHTKRAVYIARNKNIKAFGYNAKSTKVITGLQTRFREFFARTIMFYDLYIINKKPKFLGEKITIK
jgi:SanA protein